MSRAELVAYAALCLIWSSTWLAIRAGVQYLPPFAFAAMRFLIASGIMALLLVALPRTRGTRPIPWLSIAVTGVLQFGVSYGLVFWAELEVSAGFASISFASIPLIVAVLARFMLHEPLGGGKLIGVLLGLAGIALLFLDRFGGSGASIAAKVGMIVAAFASALANLLVQRDQRDVSKRIAITGQMIVGTVFLAGFTFVLERDSRLVWNTVSVFSLLYLAILGSVVAFILYYWLLHRTSATKSTTIAFVAPVLTVVLDHFLMGETLGWNHLVGGVLIVTGSALVVLSRAGRQA